MAGKPTASLNARDKRNFLAITLGLSPIILLVLCATIIPSLYAFGMSLYRTKFMNIGAFVGLQNYVKLFTDPNTWLNIRNSMVFVLVSLFFSVPIAFALALLLNRQIPGKNLFRSILIIPYVIAQIVIAMMWKWMIDPTFGPVSYYFQSLGLAKLDLLGTEVLSMPAVILVNIWRSYPLPLILILSALQTIPVELNEAAIIDGASWHQILHKITIPLVGYAVAVAAVLLTLEYFTMVTMIFILTGGGPLRATETLGVRVFIEGFQSWNLALAAAVGVTIFLCNGTFAYAYIKVMYREVEI